jgi:multiple sugar transport system permease protein
MAGDVQPTKRPHLPSRRRWGRRSNEPGPNARWDATQVVLALLIALVLILYVFPYLYLVLTSFKTPSDASSIPPTIFPETFSTANYQRILSSASILRSFGNSLIIAVLSTTFALALAIPAAYGVSRFATRAGKIFIIAALVARMVPYVSVAIPYFALMRSFGLGDTHIAVAIAHTTVSLPLAIWLLASFFESMPVELEEAARVDGCSRVGALVRVIVPLVSGGIAVTAVFAFLASWNEFLFALLLTSINAKTAPLVIAEFNTQYGLEWGTMTAIATLYSLPVILLALVLQKRIVAGLTLGAVKG